MPIVVQNLLSNRDSNHILRYRLNMIDDNENALEKKAGLPENEQDDTTVNKLQLFTYIGIVLVPFGFLFSMVLSSFLEYSRWPIYTETNITPQNEANFPAMTFCPAHDGYKEDVLRVRNIASIINHTMYKLCCNQYCNMQFLRNRSVLGEWNRHR